MPWTLKARGVKAARTEGRHRELAAARGIVRGVMLGVLVWVAVMVLWVLL